MRVALGAVAALLVAAVGGHTAAEASPPGENGVLLVVGDGDEGRGFHTIDLDTMEVTRLPVDPPGVGGAAWSPDGSRIAFTRSLPPGTSGPDLWVMQADGSEQRRVLEADPHQELLHPTWSPDGRRLAVAADRHFLHPDGPGTALVVVDSGGTTLDEAELDVGAADIESIEWSPDGGTLLLGLFGLPSDFDSTVAVFDLELRHLSTLAAGTSPGWSPDGEWIVFVHAEDPADDSRIATAVMNADGSGLREFEFLAGTWADRDDVGFTPKWSPDGTRIAYDLRHDVIEIMDPDGTNRLAYDLDLGSIVLLSWQPLVPASGFLDVEDDHVFASDVSWMRATGITRGCNPPAGNLFCADVAVSRGEAAAFLVRALGLSGRVEDAFVDDDGSVFEADIDRLAAAGITRGCDPPANDRFCPDRVLRRGEVAAFLVRAFGYVDDGGGDLFVDDDVSPFEADIDRLGAAGVTRGCNPPVADRFCPDGAVTRGQMAALLHRAMG